LFVLILLLYVVVRYRRSAHPIPSRTSHNTVIEVIWTLSGAHPGRDRGSLDPLLANQYSPPRPISR
jgi:hypothetical protein